MGIVRNRTLRLAQLSHNLRLRELLACKHSSNRHPPLSSSQLIISPPSTQQRLPLSNNTLSLLTSLLPGLSPDTPDRGLPPSFLDTLDRVDKKTLKKDDTCPICATPYLEDKYPLVVKLQCGHKFDLECIGIWFKEHSSCPMCRSAVEKRKPVVIPDDEEEYDDTYS
jgi:hypothetical protein